MRYRLLIVALALGLVAAACSSDDGGRRSYFDTDSLSLTSGEIEGQAAETTVTYEAALTEAVPVYGGTDLPNDEPYDATFYEDYGVNPRIDTEDDAFSTFAVDVDTGSYTIGRRYLGDGYLPDSDSVRVEEYVNFFDQRYTPPTQGVFEIHLEGGPSPFTENDRYQMLRIGVQSMVIAEDDRKPANLTFVIDVSGSMDREDRLETVKEALRLLVGELRPSDTVAIVVYGSRGEVILDPTAVEEERDVLRAIDRLRPGGSTNAEEGLVLAYDLASRMYTRGAINRVILLSDGVANVGNTGADSILATIEDRAADGIQLVTVGFGMGNYNDVLMEQLADDGDGFYAYVDDIREAERLFVHDLTGTLQTVARDAKIQVEFNPAVVERYRLVGFENRALADDEFRDNSVDAGEIGAGHSVTALYEVKLSEDAPAGVGVATARLRWLDPERAEVTEISREVLVSEFAADYRATSGTFQLTNVVATYAEILRDSYWVDHLDLRDIVPEAERVASMLDDDADVVEFARLVQRAANIDS